jgi:nitrilase
MTRPPNASIIKVALAQVAPVFLDRAATLEKVVQRVDEAAAAGCSLVAFGEALVPGYPIWLGRMDGARFNAQDLKEMHALYVEQAVDPLAGDLDDVCAAAERGGVAVVLGTIERAADRGGHSLYCSLIYIEPDGYITSVHRKLMPTYEERLAWAPGDGAGLVTHPLGPFTVGALNCWENWMPMARSALYAAGEDLHVAIWPGSERNTEDISRFIAKESRSFVLSTSALIRASDIPADSPHRAKFIDDEQEMICDGGSCIAGPDGQWIIPPQVGAEGLFTAEVNHQRVLEERQNFDPSGHYARPEILRLTIDRRRHSAARWIDEEYDPHGDDGIC